MQVIKGKVGAPWAVICYGQAGIGKSSWAARAPKPLFIDLEDGLARIDCDRLPVVTTYAELVAALKFAVESDYKTIVFDTADALEKILIQHVCERGNKESLADFGYGKGEVALRAEWTKIINAILRLKMHGKNVLMTAHDMVQRVEDPSMDSYDRYTLNIDKKAAPAVVAAMDAVFFARYETILKDRDDSKNAKKRAVGTGKRILHTLEEPAFVAKNRFGLPAVVPMSVGLFAQLAPQETKPVENVNTEEPVECS